MVLKEQMNIDFIDSSSLSSSSAVKIVPVKQKQKVVLVSGSCSVSHFRCCACITRAAFRPGRCPDIPEILKFVLKCPEIGVSPEIRTYILKF